MKPIWFNLLAPAVLVLGLDATGTALAQTGPAGRDNGFGCNVDLSVLPPPDGYTGPTIVTVLPGTGVGFTERLCSNSTEGSNVHIVCETPVPGWPVDAAVTATGFECRVDRGACGAGGIESTTASSLDVSYDALTGEGDARLRCNLN